MKLGLLLLAAHRTGFDFLSRKCTRCRCCRCRHQTSLGSIFSYVCVCINFSAINNNIHTIPMEIQNGLLYGEDIRLLLVYVGKFLSTTQSQKGNSVYPSPSTRRLAFYYVVVSVRVVYICKADLQLTLQIIFSTSLPIL